MALVRYRPFGRLLPFRDEMDRLFEGFFGYPEGKRDLMLHPPMDLVEEDDHYTITAELPGLKAEDVKITLTHNILTVEGEKKQEREQKERNYDRVERSYGHFRRSFALPNGVQADKVKGRRARRRADDHRPQGRASQGPRDQR